MVATAKHLVDVQGFIDAHHKSRDSSSLLGVHVHIEEIENDLQHGPAALRRIGYDEGHCGC
jgi:hypothetical protein